MNFCEQLTKLRKEKGISQEALAEVIGVSRQAISKWETGATQPEMSNILRLCEILNVSPNELLCHEVPVDLSEESDQPPSANDSQTTSKRPRMKLIIALLLVICFVSGTVLGIVIKSNLPGEDNRQDVPIEFLVSGFDMVFDSFSGVDSQILRLTFTPNISNPKYSYKIVITEGDGDSRQVDAKTEAGGVFTGTFYVEKGKSYLISVSMEVGEHTYSDALLRITEVSDFSYEWQKIED